MLLPCPFCGGKAEGYYEGHFNSDYVKCEQCGVSQKVGSHKTANAAAEAWNARVKVSEGSAK